MPIIVVVVVISRSDAELEGDLMAACKCAEGLCDEILVVQPERRQRRQPPKSAYTKNDMSGER